MTVARKLGQLGLLVGTVLVTPVMLGSALLNPAPSKIQSPAALVRNLDQHAGASRWGEAHALFSYRAKGEAMLPELWAAAPEEERLALVTFLQAQAERTWTKAHTSEAFTQGNRLSEIQLGPELILVEQIVKSSTDARENGFLYWFLLDEGQWKIVDRTQRIDGRHREPSGLVRVLRNRISSQIGRPPTLGEFVANAPSWLPRIRIRSLAVE